MTAPNDPRLPEEASGRVISGLYNVNQNVASHVNDVTTLASDFGEILAEEPRHPVQHQRAPAQRAGVPGRLQHRQRRHQLLRRPGRRAGIHACCGSRRIPPIRGATRPRAGPRATRASGPIPLPKIDVLVSGTFRSDQGAQLAANMAFTAAQTTLGRPFANNAPNVTVNLIEPGTLYGDRVNEFDLRFAKILRFGRTRTNVGFDVYNITELGADPDLQPDVLADQHHAWLTPNSVLQPRFWKFSVQFDF